MEIKLVNTSQNYHALQEVQGNGRAVIACTANGKPLQMIKNDNKADARILVPVKKGRMILIGTATEDGDVIEICRVLSTFSKNGKFFAQTEVLNEFRNGKWANVLPNSFVEACDVLLRKLHSSERIVFALRPIFLEIQQSKKGYAVLDEECGAERSTIVCRPNGKPSKAVYYYPRTRHQIGKQAVVEVGPRYRILRGKKTEDGYNISIYVVERLVCLDGKRVAEVQLLNRCVNGRWQHGLPKELRPLVSVLVDKIEETDAETIVSQLY